MADKKESALGAVTDFEKARVLDASGASKNIDKATMASVLAGQHPFYPKLLNSNSNANELGDGKYFYTNGDKPVNGIGANALLIQISVPTRPDKYQIVFEYNNRCIYARMYVDYWTEWKSMFSFL
jgi:hypothetical protein